ncbi:MAG: SurA N-terminal domain-containing protein [Candidatus Roizmanbacteria bacterium]|nr:SurA N-terminal domain-containing protein [Candidatus Roizmanbacteria bacterium]
MAKTKKASVKKITRSVSKKAPLLNEKVTVEVTPMQPFFKDKKFISIVLGIVTVAVLAFALPFLRNLLFAASVNGKPVSRTAVISILEKQGGKQALDTLVSKELIMQDASKMKVTASESELNGEVKKIEDGLKKSNQKLSDALTAQNMTEKDLREELKFQLILKKILGKKIEPTKKEIADYIEQNKDSIPETLTGSELELQIKDQLQNQKFSTEVQKYLTELRGKAKISYYTSY